VTALFAPRVVQAALKKVVEWTVPGPSEAARRRGRSEFWASATAPDGRTATGTVTAPEGYAFTADSALRAVERALSGIEPGALTPSRAFGADFVRSLDGVRVGPIRTERI
jgi:saccharopine dehydrogenase (NAD+, L-lysine-forming)